MNKETIHTAADLVEVSYRPDLGAVYLKWFSENDEGTRVRDAVHAALAYVRARHVENWLADVSTSPRGLSDKDQEWVSGDEFSTAISDSRLRKFVLIPRLPQTGRDVSWHSDWEANTLAKFGDHITAKLSSDWDDIRAFFLD
ncbi:MAG: hypothetical protein GY791_08040 [Alphaproteobacteria bacterium]|nr:hypothetical protein [Alphaproteobacteria bacterium]